MRRLVEIGLVPAAILVSLAAFFWPSGFVWMRPHLSLLLGLIMFGMGMTLEVEDFRRVLRQPLWLAAGVLAQFLIMPLLGFLVSRALGLGPELAAGFVLLGSCPGGTASNVISYLARANVGLSVSLTLASTLLAPLLTPWLTWLYAHQVVNVDTWGLMREIFWIVLFPLMDGLFLRWLFRSYLEPILSFFPLLSALAIVIVIGCVVGLNAERLRQMSALIALGVFLHNAGGLCLGYLAGCLISRDPAVRRTISIEVGMQNSGLAAALALATPAFGPLAALPAALFSLWHNISGAALAGYWAGRSEGGASEENSNEINLS